MKRNIVLIRKESRVIPWLFLFSWEQRKFGETFDLLTNNTLSRADLNDATGSVLNVHYGDILVKLGEIIDTETDHLPYISNATKVAKTAFLMDGDVIIADTAEDNTVGKCAEIMGISDKPVVSGLHTIPCRPRSRFARGYLGYFMNSPAFHDQLLPLMQGTKVMSVSKSSMADTLLCYPTDMAEQALIGQYFMKLDNLITLHQRQGKQSIYEPSQKFQETTSAWEQRKVGELLIERNEQAPMNEEYPLMAFIANEGVAPKGERYDRSSLVTDTENKLYKRTELGDFIYSSNNLETGSIGLNKYGKSCISPVYSIFQPTRIADSDFLGRRLVRKDFINAMVKWRQGVIYGQWRIHEADFLKIEIPVPSVEEQRKIGAFLDYLDNLITLHQREYFKQQTEVKNVKYNQRDGPVL